MCIVTIWLNSIDVWMSPTAQQFHTLSLSIGFDGLGLYTHDPRGMTRLSHHGAVIFEKLRLVRLDLYYPDYAIVGNGFVATHELQRYHDGGFVPYLELLLHRIARCLGECGLAEVIICYKVSDAVHRVLGEFDGSVWPTHPGELRS